MGRKLKTSDSIMALRNRTYNFAICVSMSLFPCQLIPSYYVQYDTEDAECLLQTLGRNNVFRHQDP